MSGGRHRQKTLIPPSPPAREYPRTPGAPSRIGDAWTSRNLTSGTENHPWRDLLNQSNMSLILRIIRWQQVTDKMRRQDHISGEFDEPPAGARDLAATRGAGAGGEQTAAWPASGAFDSDDDTGAVSAGQEHVRAVIRRVISTVGCANRAVWITMKTGPDIWSRALRIHSAQTLDIKQLYIPSDLIPGPRGESSGSFGARLRT